MLSITRTYSLNNFRQNAQEQQGNPLQLQTFPDKQKLIIAPCLSYSFSNPKIKRIHPAPCPIRCIPLLSEKAKLFRGAANPFKQMIGIADYSIETVYVFCKESTA